MGSEQPRTPTTRTGKWLGHGVIEYGCVGLIGLLLIVIVVHVGTIGLSGRLVGVNGSERLYIELILQSLLLPHVHMSTHSKRLRFGILEAFLFQNLCFFIYVMYMV